MASEPRPPLPPFTSDTAAENVRKAEDAWNSREPERVALAYTVDSRWRNRSEFLSGRDEIVTFLRREWAKELDYRLTKELWAFADTRIASINDVPIDDADRQYLWPLGRRPDDHPSLSDMGL
jgi:nuclear transport factor 2 (NTF2) superfamily protein